MTSPELVVTESLAELGDLYGVDPVMITLAKSPDEKNPTDAVRLALEYMVMPGIRLLRQSAHEAGQHTDTAFAPRTDLGQLACAFTRVPFGPDVIQDGKACREAEPRFMETLAAIEGHKPFKREDHRASTLYVDTDGQPLALRKNHGQKTTLVLRPSPFIPYVPPGTIVTSASGSNDPFLGADVDKPVKTNNDQLQLAVVNKPHTLAVVRPSVFSLSTEFIAGSQYSPEDYMNSHYTDYAREVSRFSIARIVSRVDDIAASVRT